MTAPKHTPGDEISEYHISVDDLHRMSIEDTVHGVTLHKRTGFHSEFVPVTLTIHRGEHYKAMAAGELYEALAWYVENDDVNEEPGNEHWLEGRDRAKAALAKARGEANG